MFLFLLFFCCIFLTHTSFTIVMNCVFDFFMVSFRLNIFFLLLFLTTAKKCIDGKSRCVCSGLLVGLING
ncbi:hypothetical protein B0H65DRAFT_191614 [Neurospora tetraspora]|uniref:Secreted protein n=1 Tax=Neurospora tetraspora TaxID=94610 RepID=A0AAE0JFF0_9PEZI|nr:hypothetical protein B0H65DRAFT_191614 [Neurospora tetraspora]